MDNFGNRVDYVSPYQNKPGRGRRPASGNAGQPRSAGAGAGSNAGRGAGRPKGKGQGQGAKGQGQGQGQGRNGSRRNADNRRREPEVAARQQEVAKPEKQPVIIHKSRGGVISAEMLDQLPSSRKREGEKPALLTRNR